MSISGSTGVMQLFCYNSIGFLFQLYKLDCDSLSEYNLIKIVNGFISSKGEKGNRFENSYYFEEELKISVCKLVFRIGEIERKLELLLGVREEIFQVLGKLNKLDQKIQQFEKVSVQIDLNFLTSEVSFDESVFFRMFYTQNGFYGFKLENIVDWCCFDVSGSNSESFYVKVLKKSFFIRLFFRFLIEENSVIEFKIVSIFNSFRDWRIIIYINRMGFNEEEIKDRGFGENKDWYRNSKEVIDV